MAMKREWRIEPSATVTFVSPDMNWDDVGHVLNGKAQVRVVNGEGNFVEERAATYIAFFDEVRAYTDLSHTNYNVFCLSGMARVGMTKKQMETVFWNVRRFCMEHDVVRDPYVWPIMELPKAWQTHYMGVISASEELSIAFVRDEPMDAIVTEHILLSYAQR
jgi:hypothetical protein